MSEGRVLVIDDEADGDRDLAGLEEDDRVDAAVVEHTEIRGGEIRDAMPARISDRDGQDHQLRANGEGGLHENGETRDGSYHDAAASGTEIEEAVRAAAIFFVRPAGTLDLPKVRAYARAYRRTAGATPSELAAAVHRVWWERLNDFWMLRWHYERGDTRADPQFPAASALAVWWTREYDTVCGAFVE